MRRTSVFCRERPSLKQVGISGRQQGPLYPSQRGPLDSLLHLSPDLALLTATLGICLLFLELNRPGTILPGALGLLLTLLAAAALLQHRLNPGAAVGLVVAVAALAGNLYRPLPTWFLISATIGLIASLHSLLAVSPSGSRIHFASALVCGGLLGTASAVLSRIAFRARRLKAVH